MKTILTLLLCHLGLSLNAQVNLTSANVPAPGTVFVNADANIPSVPFTFNKSGENNIWDFTGLSTISADDDTLFYVAPSAIPASQDFPGSNLVSYEKVENIKSFVRVNQDGAYLLGMFGDIADINQELSFPLETPVLLKPFPFNRETNYEGTTILNKKVSGIEAGIPFVDSVQLDVVSETRIEMIAAGNLVLPSGTYPAILERNVTTTSNSTTFKAGGVWAPANAETTIDSTFRWYTNESTEAFAKVLYEGGTLTDVTFFKSSVVAGFNDAHKVSFTKVKCFPNPAQDEIFMESVEPISKITISNTGGTELYHNAGSNTVNIGNLLPGLYFLKAYLKSGAVEVKTFVKN